MCRILRPDSLPKEKRNYCKTLFLPNFCYLFAGVILHKLCGTLSVVVQCIAEKRGIDLSFFKKKKNKDILGLKKPLCLSLEERRTLSYFR